MKKNTIFGFKINNKKSHKGIHAKTKMSKNKNSKLYFKVNRGQGK